jgi:hypothetical protein
VCRSLTSARRTSRVTHPEPVLLLARIHVHISLRFRHRVISVFSVQDLFFNTIQRVCETQTREYEFSSSIFTEDWLFSASGKITTVSVSIFIVDRKEYHLGVPHKQAGIMTLC